MSGKQLLFKGAAREKLLRGASSPADAVAVLRVGALTEAELKNRKEALDDAIGGPYGIGKCSLSGGHSVADGGHTHRTSGKTIS